jgi:cytochrome P450
VNGDKKVVVDFDHHSELFALQGEEIERDLRARCPVAWSASHGGFWVVSRHKDITSCLRNHEVFSSKKTFADNGEADGGLTIPILSAFRNIPDETDPPEWDGYRRLLNPTFSPSAVDRLRPEIQAITSKAIDAVIESGSVDFVMQIANPVTARVTLRILGLAEDDLEFYADPLHKLSYMSHSREVEEGFEAIHQRILETIAARRLAPEDRLLDKLIAAHIDGEALSDVTIVDIVNQILLGGFDTTSSLLANALLYLDEHRGEHQRLIESDDYIQVATEEFVRWVSPSIALARTARQEVEVHGQTIRPGEMLLFLYRSANRDETVFDDPDEVDLGRFPNRHAGFGIGIHRCLGSNLARVMFQTMLREVLRRMPDYEVDRDRAQRFPERGMVNGWITMPATFSPGERAPCVEADYLTNEPASIDRVAPVM